MIRIRSSFLALAAILLSPMAANADVIGEFNLGAGGGPIPNGGQILLELNADGTIAASLESLIGTIVGFGIDAGFTSAFAPEYDFSTPTPDNLGGWGTSGGSFGLGFYCGSACSSGAVTAMTWTIGSVGQFSSVNDLLGGSDSSFDFFLLAGGQQTFANAAPVPEPGTLALIGLGLLGMAARRRKKV